MRILVIMGLGLGLGLEDLMASPMGVILGREYLVSEGK